MDSLQICMETPKDLRNRRKKFRPNKKHKNKNLYTFFLRNSRELLKTNQQKFLQKFKNNPFIPYLHFTNLCYSFCKQVFSVNTPSKNSFVHPSLLLCKIDLPTFTSQLKFGRQAGAPRLLYHTKMREFFSGRQLPENLTFLAYCEIYLPA